MKLPAALCTLFAFLALGSAGVLRAQSGAGDIDGACSCVPGLDDVQQTEITRTEEAAEEPLRALKAARAKLDAAVFTTAPDPAAIAAAVAALAAEELRVAQARATVFAKLQAGPHRLNEKQVSEVIQFRTRGGPAGRGGAPGGAGGRGGGAAAPAAAGRGGPAN
jgi:hypothetical protein